MKAKFESPLYFAIAVSVVVFLGTLAVLFGDGGRHRVDANDFPPMPPAWVVTNPLGYATGQPASPLLDAYGSMYFVPRTPSGAAIDLTQPGQVYPYLSTSWTTNDVSCTSAGTVVALADSAGAAKQRSFSNVSGNVVYIGQASGVTASTGFPLPSGVAPSNPMPGYTGPVYCYAASTSSLGVSQLQ